MANDTKFFDELIRAISLQMSVGQLCKVVSYDKGARKANVQPMALKSDGSKRGLIQDALVLHHCHHYMRAGQVVFVVFCDRDLDNAKMAGSAYRIGSKRVHSVNDAVVVGVWSTDPCECCKHCDGGKCDCSPAPS